MDSSTHAIALRDISALHGAGLCLQGGARIDRRNRYDHGAPLPCRFVQFIQLRTIFLCALQPNAHAPI